MVKIKLEAAPRYILTLSTLKPTEGINKIQEVIDEITKEIKIHGGHLIVKEKPKQMISDDAKSDKTGVNLEKATAATMNNKGNDE